MASQEQDYKTKSINNKKKVISKILVEQLDLDKFKMPTQKVYEKKTVEPGVYEAKITDCYNYQADSGAIMCKVEMTVKDENGKDQALGYTTCLLSSDKKGNKGYYVKKDKKIPLLGVTAISQMLKSINLDFGDFSEEITEIKDGDNKRKVKVLKGAQGKELTIGVIIEMSTYDGNDITKNDVKMFLSKNGNNTEGKNIVKKLTASIEKNLIRDKRKAKKEDTPTDW